jgi:two-component system, OmpR family, phosphate regulon sensor histidine kinase PhoR
MKKKSRYIVILGLLFGYILFQFMWWEILLVRQNGVIINEQQKLLEITSTNQATLKADIDNLHHRKKMQTIMIVGEGTVFLLLLLYGLVRIKQSHDKETKLNQQQRNFFLSITHELKTPIAATKLQLQTLQKQKLNPETQNELISSALLETERLNLLIDNVLMASSLDNNQLNFKLEPCDLSSEVEKIVTRYYKKEIEKNELDLIVQSNINANIDVHAFPSVITNLITNAFKYSKENKKVRIELKKQNSKIYLSISDYGCGISEEDKTKIFERFYRAGNEETRSSKGTGLGLFIVKYIVDKHNAVISIRNNLPLGTVFEIEFHAA